MGEVTGIEMASGTFNTVHGCDAIAAGCGERNRHDYGDPELNALFARYPGKCYAKVLAENRSLDVFGPPAKPRHRFIEANVMRTAMKINNQCQQGRKYAPTNGPYICFPESLGDFFDPVWEREWRDWFWDLILATPYIRYMIITKRLHLARKLNMFPPGWPDLHPHVTIVATVALQRELEPMVKELVAIPAMCRGIIFEPQLQFIDPAFALEQDIDWFITGGESGGRYITGDEDPEGKAAPYDLDWARSIMRPVVKARRAFFFKQGGSNPMDHGEQIKLTGHGGRLGEIPPELRTRQWPAQMTEPHEKLRRRAFKAGIILR